MKFADGRDVALPALAHVEQSHEIADPHPLMFKLVFDRKAESIRLQDYFAAIYLTDPEVLRPFWRSKRDLDLFVRECCGITDPVWFYRIDFYMWVRDPNSKWHEDLIHLPHSLELTNVLNDAAELALTGTGPSTSRPTMEIRHVILALAAHPELEFTREAIEFGMKSVPG
jgi:hypothetical protein